MIQGLPLRGSYLHTLCLLIFLYTLFRPQELVKLVGDSLHLFHTPILHLAKVEDLPVWWANLRTSKKYTEICGKIKTVIFILPQYLPVRALGWLSLLRPWALWWTVSASCYSLEYLLLKLPACCTWRPTHTDPAVACVTIPECLLQ